MDALTQTEINRINKCEETLSDFETSVAEEIAAWLVSKTNWLETYQTFEQAVKAFWEEKLGK